MGNRSGICSVSRAAEKAAAGSVMDVELDLFGETASPRPHSLPGLRNWDHVISPAQEAALIRQIDASKLAPFRFQGWLGKRLTCALGWTYDFDSGRFEQGPSLPDWLLPFRNIAAQTVGLAPDRLVQALLSRYDPGAGIGWHKDRPVFEHVIGLSLGNPAPLRFRRRTDGGFARFTHRADPRSLYHLSGEARHDWEHSIAEMSLARWSITFRSLTNRSAP